LILFEIQYNKQGSELLINPEIRGDFWQKIYSGEVPDIYLRLERNLPIRVKVHGVLEYIIVRLAGSV